MVHEVIGQTLEIVDVDLTGCETLPLVSLVERLPEFPSSRGAGRYEAFDSILDYSLLLLSTLTISSSSR